VQGRCWTVGLELLLAADVRVAAANTDFAQLEVLRGISPGAGATIRLVQEIGWGNAMRWLLTGDSFDAGEALRLGLVQSVVDLDELIPVATGIAARIAEAAPLGVQAIRESARLSVEAGFEAAAGRLFPELVRLFTTTADGAEGYASFRERRRATFTGQ
jgi:enoyl-CoA hydratase